MALEKRSLIEASLGSIHKRVPQRPATVPNDIYVSNKTTTAAIIKRVTRLMLKENQKTVTLHGLGAMILRTSSMALAAQAALEDQVILKPITETITLVDDIIPEDMDQDLFTQKRANSAIHIQIEAKEGLTLLQKKTGKIIHRPSRNRRSRKWH
ncbi:Ribonuclease P protein subunit p20 [Choanephora cucurbitarum]|uniref:Ribonuclease P protein subunit p20 n=1 Tax=Choanephora cucurbitarum TaxID=101091 RepID=A0A1C7N1R7_9FUNG|nr:Ribonuclease P protein subunit p20 [Choanephora cucurbitarum]